jgi:hypothetical protein
VRGFTGTMVIETHPSELLEGYLEARVVEMAVTAPEIETELGSTGMNYIAAEPDEAPFYYGLLDQTTGLSVIGYTGYITNDIYTEANPLPFFSNIVATYDPEASEIRFETSVMWADDDTESGQRWGHDEE